LNSSLLDDILRRKLLFISGKGGVGKSLATASLAKVLRSLGKKVLVVESNLSEQLSPLLAFESAGHDGMVNADGIHIMNLDPRLNFKDFIVKHLGFESMFKKVFSQSLVKSFLDVIPGLLEMTLIGRLFYESKLREDQIFDHVIFDSYALGHHLTILQTPDAILKSELKGLVFDEVRKVKAFLSSEEVASIILSQPEPLIFSETTDFIPKLIRETDVDVIGVVVNRTLAFSLEALQKQKSSDVNFLERKISQNKNLNQQHREWVLQFNQENDLKLKLHSMQELFWIQEPLDLSTSMRLWDF
jgi:arsenite-transporting ATPase